MAMKKAPISPDLVLINGNLRTQDPANPRAEALAVGAGRILAVGDTGRIAPLATPQTECLDLGGRLGLPGFVDVHFHYFDWAMARLNLDLAGLPSFRQLIETVQTAASQTPAGEWILGLGFNEVDWPERRMPIGLDLDIAAPDHPVFLLRCDLHLAVANSRALEYAGIRTNSPDPPGGLIARDEIGRPTGILREQAVNLIKDVLPHRSQDKIVEAMGDGLPALHAMGLTGLHDIRYMGGAEGAAAMKAWQQLRNDGNLNLRTWVTIPGERLDDAIGVGLVTGFGDERLRIGHVKFFADGGMGARTAWMIDPYLDAPQGLALIAPDELQEAIIKAERAGLACAVHAIGDRANRELIRIYETLAAMRGKDQIHGGVRPQLAHRIEHLQMVRPQDLRRLAALDLTVSMQPHNAVLDMNLIDACIGANAKYAYAFRSVLDAGINVCFSSDAPVSDPRPLVNIHAAVNRCRRDGTPCGGWYPDQKVSVEQAVQAYTMAPAAASGAVDDLGSLTPGKRADVIVLSRDIYAIDPLEIIDSAVDLTIFDGRIVYRRPSS